MDKENNSAKPLTDEEIAAEFPALLPLVRVMGDIWPRTPSPELAMMAQALETYFRTRD